MIVIPRLEWSRLTEMNTQTHTDQRIIIGLIIRRLVQTLGNVPLVPTLILILCDHKIQKPGIVQTLGTHPPRLHLVGKTGNLHRRPL